MAMIQDVLAFNLRLIGLIRINAKITPTKVKRAPKIICWRVIPSLTK